MTTIKEYVYTRIKNVFEEDDESERHLFLYAGLTKNTINIKQGIRKKNVKVVVAKVVELPLIEAPAYYQALPDQEIRTVIDYSEFKHLKDLSVVDEEAFLTYNPSTFYTVIERKD